MTDVYLRISQDRAGEELGVERQRAKTRQRLKDRGWTLGVEHVENDRSASGKVARPKFDAMLKRIEEGKVQVVLAWSLDRLTRNRRDQLRLFEACEEHKVMIALVEGSDIDMSSFAGQLVGDILAGQARAEIKQKSKRQTEANEQAAAQGRRTGGRKPFGYEQDGMTLIPREAEAIRKAYADLLSGVTLARIARDWNTQGLLSGQRKRRDNRKGPKGAPTTWSHDTVRLVLRNPRNAGIRTYKGREIGPAVWPPIITEETFRAALDVLNDGGRNSGGTGRLGMQLLTGIAVCGVCGETVHAGGSYTPKYRMYRCSAGGHVGRRLEPVDAYVGEVLVSWMQRPDVQELLIDRKRPDVDALRAKATALRIRRDTLAAEYAADDEGVFTVRQFKLATKSLNEKLAQVETEMADAGRVDLLRPLLEAEDVAAEWAYLYEHHKDKARAIVASVMEVTIHPAGRGVRVFRPESVDIRRRD